MSGVSAFAALAAQLERRKEIYKLEYYIPYPKQLAFHNAVGKGTTRPATERLGLGGNQVGKTTLGAMEMAMHLTGRYPIWYAGVRYQHPIEAVAAGVTNNSTRDIIQLALLGDPLDEKKLGTGAIPIDCIGKPTRKAGVTNAYDSCTVKHFTGGKFDGMSNLYLRAYEQGFKAFMGVGFQVGWMDEEPPQAVLSQFLRAMIAQRDPILFMTMTPEEGMTATVAQFMNDLKEGQYLTTLTWDDAPHLSEETKRVMIEKFPEHEREMRRNGSPLMGAGVVFSTPDEDLTVDPFEIPAHWAQINGVDFGWDHPFGAARIAWDRDNDIVYVTAEYRESRVLPAIHAVTLNAWGTWIPVAWPHDGLNTEKGTGEQLRSNYVAEGVNFLPWKATNSPQAGQKEGEGGNSVWASLTEMIERMQTGRFKVFRSCKLFFEEKRMYHTNLKGEIVKQGDNVLDACRYAVMMLRHARTQVVRRKVFKPRKGRGNWGNR
jgi:phage terminase large subunit-like protein